MLYRVSEHSSLLLSVRIRIRILAPESNFDSDALFHIILSVFVKRIILFCTCRDQMGPGAIFLILFTEIDIQTLRREKTE